MSVPKPVPRKKKAETSPSLPRNITAKDLDVKGLRSKLDEMSMQQLRDILEDAAALHDVITSLNVGQVCCKHPSLLYI